MSRCVRFLVVLAAVFLLPSFAWSQSITGTVKDSSGAVLPGVTVEAASPALIEKIRTAVTDGTGQYRIEALRPGMYSVTFSLAGFSTVKRDGIELSGSFAATVNAEMQVGALEETLTVTGEAPLIDVQSTVKQAVLDHDIVDAIPAGRGPAGFYSYGLLLPGTVAGNTAVQDVGGSSGTYMVRLSAHGGDGGDQLMTQNGVNVGSLNDQGWFNRIVVNVAATRETSIDTAAISAEFARGGVHVNIVPKDGGNTREGTLFAAISTSGMQSTNITQALKDRGLSTQGKIKQVTDFNPGFGGPLKENKLWFYLAALYNTNSRYIPGSFNNLNYNKVDEWTFVADLNHPATADSAWRGGNARLTWQATPKNKVGVTWAQQVNCECSMGGSATAAPETALYVRYPNLRQVQADWTAPLTTRLLWEAGGLIFAGTSDGGMIPGLNRNMISVQEQSTGLLYRSGFSYRYSPNRALHFRGAVSYVPGAHAVKVGFDHKSGWATDRSYVNNAGLQYRFNNGVPNQITMAAYPYDWTTDVDHDMGVFAQDKWTAHRLTATYGARWDWFKSSSPAQHLGSTVLTPGRDLSFPAEDGASLKDLTPRLGASYDVFGNGKTAVKATLNKYLQGLSATGIAAGLNPVNRIVVTTTRSWTDANRNYVPDCSLSSPLANGECGAMANANFGTSAPGAAFDPDIVSGWGKRNYNYEFSTGVQHELMPRMSLDVSYFRRWFGNFAVTDNTLAAPSDYTRYSITAPVDPRLPGGGGYTVAGLYDLNPNRVGQISDLITLGDKYGKMIRHWDGADISISSRPRNGLRVQGGISLGREIRDYCDVIAKLPEILSAPRQIGPRAGSLSTLGFTAGGSEQTCHQAQSLQTMVKALSSYTIPTIDVLLSVTVQSLPGPGILATYNAPNALVQPSLGRPLSANAANATVQLVAPGQLFGERSNQVDVRFGKVLRFGQTRTSVNLDVFNALNANPVLTLNNNFGAWQQPNVILAARLLKMSVQFDF